MMQNNEILPSNRWYISPDHYPIFPIAYSARKIDQLQGKSESSIFHQSLFLCSKFK